MKTKDNTSAKEHKQFLKDEKQKDKEVKKSKKPKGKSPTIG